jgi:hypothetical protein
VERLGKLIEEHIGPNAIVGTEEAPVIVLASGDPTPEQQTLIDGLLRFWRSGVTGITYAEWQGLRDDLNGLRQYHGLASPNLSQTVLATKALIRVVGAILRDSP